MRTAIILVFTAILVSCGFCLSANAQQADMRFFITSVGSGKGGDLGGLAGADAHCQSLAQAAGAANKTWRAYLSTNARGGANPVHARDRIGNGPWQNAKGAVIATSVADLHSDNNKISKANAFDEKGQPIKVRGDTPVMHAILTGSDKDVMPFLALASPCSGTLIARAVLPWPAPRTWRPIWSSPIPGMLPTPPAAAPSPT